MTCEFYEADGQGRREVIEVELLHLFGSSLHALLKTDAAAGAAFRFVFKPLYGFKIRFRFVRGRQKLDIVSRLFIIVGNECFLHPFPPLIFASG